MNDTEIIVNGRQEFIRDLTALTYDQVHNMAGLRCEGGTPEITVTMRLLPGMAVPIVAGMVFDVAHTK